MSSDDREACLRPDLYSLEVSQGSWLSRSPTPEVSATEIKQQHSHISPSRGRRAFHDFHEGISKAFKNAVTSALPSRSKKNQAQETPQPTTSPTNSDCQTTVPPLKVIDHGRGRSRHRSSPSSARRPATMMTEARELFEKYGIDRPPG